MLSSLQKKLSSFSRRSKWLLGAAAALVVYALVGFLIAPPIIRWQLAKQLSAATGLNAAVAKVKCNPFTLELDVHGLAVGPDATNAWLKLDRFHANLQLASIWRWEFVLREVSLDRPELLVQLDQQGAINLLQLASRLSAANTEAAGATPALPRASIASLAISNAVVRWQDDFVQPGFHAALTGGALTITNFHTLATNRFYFAGVLDAATALAATGDFALDPVLTDVSAAADQLSLARYAGYLPEWSPLRVTNGIVDAKLIASARFHDGKLAAEVRDATIKVRNLAVVTAQAQLPVLSVAETKLEGLTANLTEQSASLRSLAVAGPLLSARRLTNGVIDWQVWMQQIIAHLPAGNTNVAPWNWSVGNLAATNATVQFSDEVPVTPVSLAVTNAWLTATGLTNDLRRTFPLALGFALSTGGCGTITGELTPIPLAGRVRAKIENVFLPVAQPYLTNVLKANLSNGFGAVDGALQVSLSATNALTASFVGDVGARDVVLLEHDSTNVLASVEQAAVKGLKADWPLDDLEIASVTVTRPLASLILRADGTANVEEVIPRKLTEQLYQQLNAAWQALQFEITELQVAGAQINLMDESIQPAFESRITDIQVALRGLKPQAEKPAELEIGGKVHGTAPFSVVAQFKPEGTNLTAKVNILSQVVAVPPGSPYAGRWLGYLIAQGKVSVDLRYELDHQQIKGENRVIVDDFEFGSKTGSGEAIKLPVKIGVALLKDRNGRIDLDVPVAGSLADPKFKLSRVIWQAIGNIFEKAMTAPFKFLGALVGAGDDEDLASVAFATGSTELLPKEAAKLDQLAKALFQRPQLKLEIVGRFDPLADDAALRRAKFETERRGFEQALPGNAELSQLAVALKMASPPSPAELTTLFYVKTFAIPFQLPTNSLNSATTTTATSAPATNQTGATTTASSGTPSADPSWLGRAWKSVGDEVAWKGAKQPGSSSAPVSGSGTNRPPATDPTKDSTTPAAEPPPILPPLPELKALEAQLIERQAVTPEEMQALAAARAQAVQTVLLAKPELTPERIVVAPELSGAEPAGRQARVFLGIQ